MNLLFFLTPKQDVLYIYEDFTLRQTLEKWANQRFATIPVLKRNGEYVGTITEGDILWGIKNLHGLDPVSYTHLDVYKRQVVRLRFTSNMDNPS